MSLSLKPVPVVRVVNGVTEINKNKSLHYVGERYIYLTLEGIE